MPPLREINQRKRAVMMSTCHECEVGQRMNRIGRVLLFLAAASLSAVGCVQQTPKPAPMATLQCDLPSITPQDETRAPQNKGGLQISILPVTYTAAHEDKIEMHQVSPQLADELIAGEGYFYVERTTKPIVHAKPDQLRFLVNINNKMPRVFHGAGTVVQFNLDGQILPVDQRGYSSVQGAIVPPQQEQQIEIVGPPLSALKGRKGILGIFLYDVVTSQSDAGVVTEKQNFQWYFDYVLEPHEEQVPAAKTVTLRMTPTQFQQTMARQSMESGGTGMPADPSAPPAQ
jgi:hypothetical protein